MIANPERSSSSGDDFEMSQLRSSVGRRIYLVTYSQADLKIFPTRESFGNMIELEFNKGDGKVKVLYWSCCMEPHENGGVHYHCSIKLSGSKKWFLVKRRIAEIYGVQVHFSESAKFYLAAYRYVCKTDKNVAHSLDHPKDLLLNQSPKTKKAIYATQSSAAKRRKSKSSEQSSTQTSSRSEPPKKRKSRINNLTVASFVRNNNIKSYTELLAVAESRQNDGQIDIAEFVFNRSEKCLRELIDKAWKMANAKALLEHENKSRLDVLTETACLPCVMGCNSQWLKCALEVLQLNCINRNVFAECMRDLLLNGRAKHRNILIIGPANCAKTFMLKPLKEIFKHEKLFENPACDKYAWVGADRAQVILLNDFRWSRDLIPWNDLLLLLEGETVKLPAPKNMYSQDVLINSDVPVFATSKCKIRFRGSYNVSDERENEMMDVRWRIFEFSHVFKAEQQKHPIPCGKCFCDLIFHGDHSLQSK